MRSVYWSLFLLCIVSGCKSETRTDATKIKILNISEYPFTYRDEKGVFINFATEGFSECSLTLAQSSLRTGVSLETHISEGPLDLSCLSGGQYYMLNDEATTVATVLVKRMDATGGHIVISGTMYSVGNQQFIELSDSDLILSTEEVKKLRN